MSVILIVNHNQGWVEYVAINEAKAQEYLSSLYEEIKHIVEDHPNSNSYDDLVAYWDYMYIVKEVPLNTATDICRWC